MRRALKIDEASYGKDHPNVARDFNNLAQLLQATNRLAEAEPLMRRALEIDEASYGKDHPDVASDLNNLAYWLKATNRLAEAEALLRRVVKIFEISLGENHPNVGASLGNLAALLKATNRIVDAEPLMRRVVEILLNFTMATGYLHPQMQMAINNYYILLEEMGYDQARINELFGDMGIELSEDMGGIQVNKRRCSINVTFGSASL